MTTQEKIKKLEGWLRYVYHNLPEGSGLPIHMPSDDNKYRLFIVSKGKCWVVNNEAEGLDCGGIDYYSCDLTNVIKEGYSIKTLYFGLLSQILNPDFYPEINLNNLIKEMKAMEAEFMED